MAYFNPSKPTVVEANSFSNRIGGCLLQEFDDGLTPIAYCSRTLASAENVAQIERECLASVWACERFDRYLMGLDTFTLLTDHKPLVPLINSKDLSETPIRCQRILIRLMREILSKIHDVHPGITKSRERAKQAVWWTGISKDIQQMVSQCRHCLEKSAIQQKEQLMTSKVPDRPFQKIAVDICELNRETYLVSVDYYSRYIDINKLNSITSNTVINKIKMNC